MIKGDIVYYARIIPTSQTFDVCTLIVRTVEDDWFVGFDKNDKHAYLFSYHDVDDLIFVDREDALAKVLKAQEEEGNK